MKFRISLILTLIAMAASSAVSAHDHDKGCTDSTIKGPYAFTVHGQILTPNGPIPIEGLAKTTFDGNGNLTQVDTIAENGNVSVIWRPGTGTYTVNSDCTGTMTVNDQDLPPLHLTILVSQSGNHIRTVVTEPGFSTTSEADRVSVSNDRD
jgi:hypothetical protein